MCNSDEEFNARLRRAAEAGLIDLRLSDEEYKRILDASVQRAVRIATGQTGPAAGDIWFETAAPIEPQIAKVLPGIVVTATYAQLDAMARFVDKTDDCYPLDGDGAFEMLAPALALIGITLERAD
jgi:hypothetical protein